MNADPRRLRRIDGFEVDAFLSEEHTREAEITDFPVERRANVADHVRIKPRVFRCEGVVTNTPIGPIADLRVDPNRKPTEVARQILEDIMAAGQPIVLEAELMTYKSMVMESLSMPRDGETGDALPFSCTFREVVIVDNKRTLVRVAVPAASSEVDRGNMAGKPPGWIGKDKLGRDIFVIPGSSGPGKPGTEDRYVRADGTPVSNEEAAAAVRKNDAALVKYDKNGHAIPVDNKDYQPYTPRQKKPWWAPVQRGKK